MKKSKRFDMKDILHEGFNIGILLKGINGALEIIGGILLVFLNPTRLNRVIALLTQNELSEDPRDIFANYMVRLSYQFSANTQYFWVFYLISHGTIKLILIFLLWKRKLWAYPLTITALILFVIYQIYRYTIYHSSWLIFLTILDVLIILLTFLEYKRIKKE
ncbi:MAG: DUF2127 domain-containing protein [Aminipila sp.]